MPNYEARIVRGAGLLNITIRIECTDDRTALEKARLLLDAHDVQVWRDNEIIGTLHPHPWSSNEPPTDNVLSFRRA